MTRVSSVGCALAVTLVAAPALAQTWVGSGTRPAFREIVALDATGETPWPFGSEDVAGDGATFGAPEQSLDIRTAYAATDATRFWARAYVSSKTAVSTGITLYIFVDADQDATTGGTARAPEISPAFTTDPTVGGYEFVLGVHGDGKITKLWTWTQTPAPAMYVASTVPSARADAETHVETDPIGIGGDDHAYVQASIELGLLGLTKACAANLFFRSAPDVATDKADLDVGRFGPCVAVDGDHDGVPDIVVEPGCVRDADCPLHGFCVDGACHGAATCVVAADCGDPGLTCTPDGRCVPIPTGTCTTNVDCNDLVCVAGMCTACTLGAAECGPGEVCAPNGRCVVGTHGAGGAGGAGGGNVGVGGNGVGGNGAGGRIDGVHVPDGGKIQGGACACTTPGGGPEPSSALALLPLLLAVARRRRSSSTPAGGGAR